MTNDGKFVILLVDDENDFREIMKAKLESSGFVVVEAHNGEEGFKIAKKLNPDLVLLDVRMPKMNGVETLAKIKTDPDTAGLKILFLTNLGEEQENSAWLDDKFAKDAGAVGHIRKTDDLNAIIERINRELGLVS